MKSNDNGNNKNIKTSLKFSTHQEKKGKNTRNIAILFTAAVLVIAAVSVIVLLKENDFKINNIAQTLGAELTEEETTQKTPLAGRLNFLLVCTDDSSTEIRYIALLCSDMNTPQLRLCMLSPTDECTANNFTGTFSEHYLHAGMPQLARAVEQRYAVGVERYVKATDSTFKKAVKLFGGLEYNVPETSICELNGVKFTIEQGNQTLTPDMLMRYMIYLSQNQQIYSATLGSILCAVIDAALQQDYFENSELLFNKLSNYFDTNISVIDFSAHAQNIGIYIADTRRTPAVVADNTTDF